MKVKIIIGILLVTSIIMSGCGETTGEAIQFGEGECDNPTQLRSCSDSTIFVDSIYNRVNVVVSWDGGSERDKTDTDNIEVPSNTQIKIHADKGNKHYLEFITLEEGQCLDICLDDSNFHEKAEIRVQSIPSNASLGFDQDPWPENTPTTIYAETGWHEIDFFLTGYHSVEEEIQVEAGQIYTVRPALTPLVGHTECRFGLGGHQCITVAGPGEDECNSAADCEPVQLELKEVEAGPYFSCALTEDGKVYCWGNNQNYQLGDGTNDNSAVPVLASVLDDFAIDTLAMQSFSGSAQSKGCAITDLGTVVCWSNVVVEPLPSNFRFSHVTAESAFRYRCGLMFNTTVVCWDRDGNYQFVGHQFSEIAMGFSYGRACGIKFGDIWCWSPANPSDIFQLDNGGINTEFEGLSMGLNHDCVLDPQGRAYCWGLNGRGALGDGTRTDSDVPVLVDMNGLSFSSVHAGWGSTCGITDAGEVYCWGADYFGLLGVGGYEHIGDICTGNGMFAAPCIETPILVDFGEPIKEISFGLVNLPHACAYAESGNIYCWGSAAYGQSGSDDPADLVNCRYPSSFAGNCVKTPKLVNFG